MLTVSGIEAVVEKLLRGSEQKPSLTAKGSAALTLEKGLGNDERAIQPVHPNEPPLGWRSQRHQKYVSRNELFAAHPNLINLPTAATMWHKQTIDRKV